MDAVEITEESKGEGSAGVQVSRQVARVVRVGLMEGGTFEEGLEGGGRHNLRDNSRKYVSGRGSASAEARKWNHAWLTQVTTRSPVWLEQRK